MKLRKILDQAGFTHALVFLSIIAIAAIGFAGWRVMDKSSDSKQVTVEKKSASEADIILNNLGIASLDSVLINEYATSEFESKGLKGFYIFGDKLSEGRTNPNFEFASLKEGTQVISAIDGIVSKIAQQAESNDYEVFVQPKDGSVWTLGYDHISKLAVKEGDFIKAGDVIGEPAVQNNGSLRFELQINKDEKNVTTHYCPSVLLSTDIRDNTLAALTTMQNKWETTTGFELYDIAAQDPIGCLSKTMTSSEAEAQ